MDRIIAGFKLQRNNSISEKRSTVYITAQNTISQMCVRILLYRDVIALTKFEIPILQLLGLDPFSIRYSSPLSHLYQRTESHPFRNVLRTRKDTSRKCNTLLILLPSLEKKSCNFKKNYSPEIFLRNACFRRAAWLCLEVRCDWSLCVSTGHLVWHFCEIW